MCGIVLLRLGKGRCWKTGNVLHGHRMMAKMEKADWEGGMQQRDSNHGNGEVKYEKQDVETAKEWD